MALSTPAWSVLVAGAECQPTPASSPPSAEASGPPSLQRGTARSFGSPDAGSVLDTAEPVPTLPSQARQVRLVDYTPSPLPFSTPLPRLRSDAGAAWGPWQVAPGSASQEDASQGSGPSGGTKRPLESDTEGEAQPHLAGGLEGHAKQREALGQGSAGVGIGPVRSRRSTIEALRFQPEPSWASTEMEHEGEGRTTPVQASVCAFVPKASAGSCSHSSVGTSGSVERKDSCGGAGGQDEGSRGESQGSHHSSGGRSGRQREGSAPQSPAHSASLVFGGLVGEADAGSHSGSVAVTPQLLARVQAPPTRMQVDPGWAALWASTASSLHPASPSPLQAAGSPGPALPAASPQLQQEGGAAWSSGRGGNGSGDRGTAARGSWRDFMVRSASSKAAGHREPSVTPGSSSSAGAASSDQGQGQASGPAAALPGSIQDYLTPVGASMQLKPAVASSPTSATSSQQPDHDSDQGLDADLAAVAAGESSVGPGSAGSAASSSSGLQVRLQPQDLLCTGLEEQRIFQPQLLAVSLALSRPQAPPGLAGQAGRELQQGDTCGADSTDSSNARGHNSMHAQLSDEAHEEAAPELPAPSAEGSTSRQAEPQPVLAAGLDASPSPCPVSAVLAEGRAVPCIQLSPAPWATPMGDSLLLGSPLLGAASEAHQASGQNLFGLSSKPWLAPCASATSALLPGALHEYQTPAASRPQMPVFEQVTPSPGAVPAASTSKVLELGEAGVPAKQEGEEGAGGWMSQEETAAARQAALEAEVAVAARASLAADAMSNADEEGESSDEEEEEEGVEGLKVRLGEAASVRSGGRASTSRRPSSLRRSQRQTAAIARALARVKQLSREAREREEHALGLASQLAASEENVLGLTSQLVELEEQRGALAAALEQAHRRGEEQAAADRASLVRLQLQLQHAEERAGEAEAEAEEQQQRAVDAER